MGVIGGRLGYCLLRAVAPKPTDTGRGVPHIPRTELGLLFGPEIWDAIAGKVVIDFGCGRGRDAIEIAKKGARRVVGIDIRQSMIQAATEAALEAGVADRCSFMRTTDTKADVILSVDAFEHFGDPRSILELMSEMLAPKGSVWVSFGPPWYHPRGGHLFSVFPWAHLIFTESALIRWRSDFKTDGARRFSEVDGGLNQMSVTRFLNLVAESPLCFSNLELVPIGGLRFFTNTCTREFITSIVRCRLLHREADSPVQGSSQS